MFRLKIIALLVLLPIFSIKIQIDKPIYKTNTISTCHGGVITDENLRIQAKNIRYTFIENIKSFVSASDDLILQIDDEIYIANKIEYDFINQEGKIYNLKTQKGELYHGAQLTKIKNKKIQFENAYAYNGEDKKTAAQLKAKEGTIVKDNTLEAKDVTAEIGNNTLLNLSSATVDLNPEKKRLTYKLSYNVSAGPTILGTYPLLKTENLNIISKAEIKPQSKFAAIYTKSNFKNTNNFIKAEQNTIIIPKTDLSIDSRLHTNISFDNEKSLYAKLNVDKVSSKAVLSKYSSRNLMGSGLNKSALDLHYLSKYHQTDLLVSKRINSFQMEREMLPSLRIQSKNIGLGKNTFFFHDIDLKHTKFVYPKNFDPFFKNTNTSSITSKQSIYKPIQNYYFSLIPTVNLFEKYNHDDNSAYGLINIKIDLNSKFKIFRPNLIESAKIYSIYESTLFSRQRNIALNEIIKNESNYNLGQIKIGCTSHTDFKSNDYKYDIDTYFYLLPIQDSLVNVSNVFIDQKLTNQNSTYALHLQMDHKDQLKKAINASYTRVFSDLHAFSWDFHYFPQGIYAKNKPTDFKLESIISDNILKNSPLDHPFRSNSIKYQFSPYPLYICKLAATLYEAADSSKQFSIGANLSTTLFTIYELKTDISYSNLKGFNFGIDINLLK